MSGRVLGWSIDRDARAALLQEIAPRYARTVADHVTFGRAPMAPDLPEASTATVIGEADDGAGVQALVVEINGSSRRWDGGRYHITWSLDPAREAKESNAVIAEFGWKKTARRTVPIVAAEWP